jgi:glutathione S-transferase
MKLIVSGNSPHARKVRIVLAEKRIECTLVEQSPWAADSDIAQFNPLGKIPVLLLDDGTALYDSRVIVEYLDSVSPVNRLIPEPTRQRIAVKRFEALADGICDAAMAIALEKKRSTRQQNAAWLTRQAQKTVLGVRELANELGERTWCCGDAYSLADIAVGCALGYLELRRPEMDWRKEYPNLDRYAARLGKRPSFAETAPSSAESTSA